MKVMTVFGTRPEAIKMAPVVKALKKEENIETIVTVTAQHREMLDQVLELFEITPDYDLDIMQDKQTLSGVTARVLMGIKEVYEKENPDLVLVHGDTSTTFVSSLGALYQQIKVGHVEAGLRTHNKYSPFPEEMNRHLTGVIADLHFAPTELAKDNLLKENVDSAQITVTGNTVIDALLDVVDDNYQFEDELLKSIDFENKKIVLLTAHRRENLGKPMENIFDAINDILIENDEVEVVFPVHLNPVIRELAAEKFEDAARVHLIEPLDYEPFINLMNKSYLILTDSGGIQEEAPSLGKPVLVLRDTTERPEAVNAGTVKKVGTDKEAIYNTANELLNDDQAYIEMSQASNPYGDGQASQRIVKRILRGFNKREKNNEI
nr:UDP-N-acetylglucosamine 2-epimerase (non-hydrolyzing) [Halanaerobium congolense]